MKKEQEIFNLTTQRIEATPPEEVVGSEKNLSPVETAQTPETMEAEQVAREKLEKLMSEDFKDFAVRCMNIGEYEEILKQSEMFGGEG